MVWKSFTRNQVLKIAQMKQSLDFVIVQKTHFIIF